MSLPTILQPASKANRLLSFANGICIGILIFGFIYYILITVFYMTNATILPQMQTILESIRQDVKVWMERALMFTLGSSMGSKSKEGDNKEMVSDMVNKIANSTPIVPTLAPTTPAAAPVTPASPPETQIA